MYKYVFKKNREIFQNILFYIPQNEESHTGLERHESE